MRINLKRMTACVVAACMMAQPAFAAVTDISNVPLGSTAGASFLPNLLFILDDSGSMGSDYNPDYVNDSNKCLTASGGSTVCNRGDPPFEAGGANGFNGVGYDPNFTYLSGVSSNGQPVLNPPSGTLSPTSLTPDAYLGGGSVNLTNTFPDKNYCNSYTPAANAPCKRSGADTSATVTPAGTKDAEGHNLAAGQFPYRANMSSASIINFGLPEMMTTATFTRSGATVTATTIGKLSQPLFAANEKVYVTTGTAGLNVTCATVTSATTSTFTYTTSGSGPIAATTGSFRKCGTGTWTRSGTTVTVTASHGLQNNDLLMIDSDDNNQDKLTGPGTPAPITVTSATTFTYNGSNTGNTSGNVAWVRTGLYNVVNTSNGAPAVYSITPVEYCRDNNLTDCVEAFPGTMPTNPNPLCNPNCAAYTIPAYVRFCKTQNDALSPGTVTGNSIVAPATASTPRCQLKFVNQTGLTQYIYPRYGWFNRDTVVSTVASYFNRPGRSDCPAAPTCTYAEEIQNYAKWYTYFRTRMQMMKTSAGRSFLPFISNPTGTPPKPDRLRVGFITINPTFRNSNNTSTAPNVDSSKYLRIDTFNTANASNWYNKFYAIIPNNSTPLRLALSRAGWIYAGKLGTGLTQGIPAGDDPLQASCQKNYSFLTTDGFWNQGVGQDLNGNSLGNYDNVNNSTAAPYAAPDYFVSRASGTFDGAVSSATAGTTPGGSGTLADIAMYYYRTDLRAAGAGPLTSPSTTPSGQDVSINNVPVNPQSTVDFAIHQHMNTYTIGLADGLMRYQPNYATAATGDFAAIKAALPATGNCFWATGVCDWPLPLADGQSALDDLWHAAVNGRGQFYSAVNPNALATGLSSALNSLDTTVAAAAAAATSSPQVSQGNAKAFSTTYQTATWSGRVFAQNIDPDSGVIQPAILWEAHTLLLSKVAPTSDTRKLLLFDPTASTKLKDFRWTDLGNGALNAAERAVFLNKCVPLSNMAQCGTLTPMQMITANDGASLVGFLRGQTGNEAMVFRDRTELDPVTNAPFQTILGDIVNSQPVAVRAPFLKYENETMPEAAGETYADFRDTRINPNRPGPLLIGANDGFLHAFDPNTGVEQWGYVPRFLLPAMYQLADSGYPGQHRFFVDGSPEVTDVFDATAGVWKTIVVNGTNSGGRGYFALDITDPLNPKGLWEFCSDPAWCPNDTGTSPITYHNDPDLGFSYGNPVIGRRESDGRWVVVVTSGLNNVGTSGNGQGYFYVLDAITGAILHKIGTGLGSTTDPSGLMKIGAYYPNGLTDPLFQRVYGGDQKGNVWRIDMSAPNMRTYPAVTTAADTNPANQGLPIVGLVTTFKDPAGRIQPITARPAGTHLGKDPYKPDTRIYYVGTGRYLGNSDLADPGPTGIAWQQSIYGVRDQLDTPGFTPVSSFRTGAAVVEQKLLQGSGGSRRITKNAVDWTGGDGFFIDLNPTFAGDPVAGNSPGERVVLDVRLIQGTLVFTTTVPNSGGACTPGGNSFQYTLDYRTGGYVGNDSSIIAGYNVGKFLVGAALIETSTGIKLLNKTITGENVTTPVEVDATFGGKRFSYRER
jgi:type IV pilus assembly protein PilY1